MRYWIMLAILLLPSPLWAATYYVGPTSCSDAGAGTITTPFCTIQKGHDTALPGDTVLVKDGTYTTASTGWLTILRRSGITFKSLNKYGAKLNGQNNLTGYAFEMDSVYTTNNLVIQDFEIYGFKNGIQANTGSNMTVKGNLFHDLGRFCTDSDQGNAGILMKGTYSNLIVDGNTFHTHGRYQTGEAGCTNAGTNYQNHDHGVYIIGSTGRISNNIFYGFKAGWPIQWTQTASSGWTISNNAFSTPANTNGDKYGYILLYQAISNTQISNNIFYAPYGSCGINFHPTLGYSNVTIKNNLTYQGVAGCAVKAGVTVTGSLNNTNPLFTNVGANNYTLTASSPAINTGLNLTTCGFTTDYAGVARPTGSGTCASPTGSPWEIGAYEFGASPDITPPAAPTGLQITRMIGGPR